MNDLVKSLKITAGMIDMGELIKYGSDSELMLKAAEQIEADTALLEKIRDNLLIEKTERDLITSALGSVSLGTFDEIMQRLEGGAE